MKLEQKQGFKKRTFVLEKDKIKLTYDSFSDVKEWAINLDSIGREIITEKKSRKISFVAGGLAIAFGVFFLSAYIVSGEKEISTMGIIGISSFYLMIGLYILLMPLKKELHIVGGHNTVTFFLDSPSSNEVLSFANYLIQKSTQIIVQKYSKIDPDVPEETMINQLFWLKNNGYISEIEYEEKKEEFKSKKLL